MGRVVRWHAHRGHGRGERHTIERLLDLRVRQPLLHQERALLVVGRASHLRSRVAAREKSPRAREPAPPDPWVGPTATSRRAEVFSTAGCSVGVVPRRSGRDRSGEHLLYPTGCPGLGCEATPDFAPRSHATIHGPTPPLGRIADRTPAALGNNLLCSDAPPPPRTDFVRQRPMHTTGGGLALWPRWLRETRACRGVLGPCLRVRQEGDGVLQHLLAHRSIGLRRRRLVGVAFVTHGMVITPPKHDGFCHGAFTRAQPAQPCSLHSIRHHAPMPRSIGAVVAWCGEGRGRDSLHLPGCQPAVASRVRPQWGCWPVG